MTTIISGTVQDKEEKYKELLPQLKELVGSETDFIANLANISAAIKGVFNFFWVGFYIVKADQLVLGPFQGTVACTRIGFGKGVCGKSWESKTTIIVPDVDRFDGHIACSSLSRSEIVVPVIKSGNVLGVLDIDSENTGTFDEIDSLYLNKIVDLINC